MGYSYGYNEQRKLVLSCDNCGGLGGVRKRSCTFKVLADSGRGGVRYALPYCQPPALCGPCLKVVGGLRKLHAGCAEGAAACQAEYDDNQAKLDSGEFMLMAGWGDWAEWVPAGKVGALYVNLAGTEKWVLVDAKEYSGVGRKWLSSFTEAIEVEGEGRAKTKEVVIA